MARYRSRSRSISPRRRSRTPSRSRKLYEDDRSYRDRRSPPPSGLLLRNLPLETRPEDLKISFERFGPVKDVYLPKNYHTGEPRGFGFVKFQYAEDAADAKQRMNHKIIGGRKVRIVFAEEKRKTPREMLHSNRSHSGRSRGSYRRRSLSRSPKHHYRSYSRSRSPARSGEIDDHSRGGRDKRPSKRSPISREDSPRGNTHHVSRSRSVSYSPR